jgi:pilus assembly protein Flp/PilA
MTRKLKTTLGAFAADESGATAIEYGLIVSLIFLAIVTSVNVFANNTGEMYSEISSALAN